MINVLDFFKFNKEGVLAVINLVFKITESQDGIVTVIEEE